MLAPADPDRVVDDYRAILEGGGSLVKTMPTDYKRTYAVDWRPFLDTVWNQPADTGVSE